MIRVLEVTIEGFRSVKDPVKLSVPTGLTLFVGDNGAGKTTVAADALFWLLTSHSLRKVSPGDDIVNKEAKEAKVVAVFDSSRHGVFTVTRIKPRGKGQKLTVVGPDGVDLLADAGRSIRAKNEYLMQQLFGLSYKSFDRLFYFRPARGFMQLTDDGRKQLIEDVIGLDWIDELRSEALLIEKSLSKTDAQLERELEVLTAQYNEKKATLKMLKSQLRELKENAKARHKQQLSDLREKEKRLQNEIKNRNQKVVATQSDLAVVLSQLKDLQARQENFNKTINKLTDKMRALEYRASAIQNNQMLQLREKIENAQSLVGKDCPTCGRPVTEDTVDEVTKGLRREYAEHKATVAQITAGVEKLRAKAEEIRERFKAQQIAEQIKAKQDEQRVLSERIARAQAEISLFQQQLETTRTELLALRSRTPETEDSAVLSVTSEINATNKRLEEMKEEIDQKNKDLRSLRKELQMAKWWCEALGPKGVKSFILEKYLAQLSAQANHWLWRLSDGKLALEISAYKTKKTGGIREEITDKVTNVEGGLNYTNNSDGEQRIVDVAIALAMFDFAFLQHGKGVGLMVFDEPLDVLDPFWAENVVTLLRNCSDRFSIFLITHSTEVAAHADSILRLERDASTGWSSLAPLKRGVLRPEIEFAQSSEELASLVETTGDVRKRKAGLLRRVVDLMVRAGIVSAEDRASWVRRVNANALSLTALNEEELMKLIELLEVDYGA